MRVKYKTYEYLKDDFSKYELQLLLTDYSYRDLQNMYGYNERLFSRLAKEYNIPKNNKVISKNSNKYHEIHLDMDELKHLYLNEMWSTRRLSEYYNCTHAVISDRLKRMGIEIRPFSYHGYYKNRTISNIGTLTSHTRVYRIKVENKLNHKLNSKQCVHHLDRNRNNSDINNLYVFENQSIHTIYHGYVKKHPNITPEEFMIYYNNNLRNTYGNYDWLFDHYVSKNMSLNAISKQLGISRQTITNQVDKFNIPRIPKCNQYDK